MATEHFELNTESLLAIPVSAADRLLEAAEGNCTLVYLWLLRHRGALDRTAAGAALKLNAAEMDRVCARLGELGLLGSPSPAQKLPPAPELPEYPAAELAGRSMEDGAFSAVLAEAERMMGRLLSASELKTLFGFYDYLAMPGEVILLLLNWCIETCREKNGPGRLPSMRSVEKTAYDWANRGLLDLESAEAHIRGLQAAEEAVTRTKRAMGIRDRELTVTERKYIEGWLAAGMTPEALVIACDRAVIKTGRPDWKYINGIVKSWLRMGLHTPAEIEKADPVQRRSRTPDSEPETPSAEELERMRRLAGNMADK